MKKSIRRPHLAEKIGHRTLSIGHWALGDRGKCLTFKTILTSYWKGDRLSSSFCLAIEVIVTSGGIVCYWTFIKVWGLQKSGFGKAIAFPYTTCEGNSNKRFTAAIFCHN